jgi:hypothetical protein
VRSQALSKTGLARPGVVRLPQDGRAYSQHGGHRDKVRSNDNCVVSKQMSYPAVAAATLIIAIVLGLLVQAVIGISPLGGGIPIVLIAIAFVVALAGRSILARLARRD